MPPWLWNVIKVTEPTIFCSPFLRHTLMEITIGFEYGMQIFRIFCQNRSKYTFSYLNFFYETNYDFGHIFQSKKFWDNGNCHFKKQIHGDVLAYSINMLNNTQEAPIITKCILTSLSIYTQTRLHRRLNIISCIFFWCNHKISTETIRN